MRFHANGPSIPDVLLERCDSGRVVFLCGAGVSVPSGMPDFLELTRHVVEFFDPPTDSEIMDAFRPWLVDRSALNVPLDQIFNLLHLEYGKEEVNALVTERLSLAQKTEDCGREHDLIKRVSSSESGAPQIVTTNFDRLFEVGSIEKGVGWHVPPAFPDLNYGEKIDGVTYLHGRLVDAASVSHTYVLSSSDFGRAYLSEGWATHFIRHLLERYTVVMVGYQAEDPPVKYLLQGLNHDGQYDRSRLYAFDRGHADEIEARWRDLGVTAIAYADHSDLWETMEAWAGRADDPRRWRQSVIAKSQSDPKELLPHERGQVAHVLRTVKGARLFVEAEPSPHPEWVCVFDADVRCSEQSSGYGENPELFNPKAAYGLDDDLNDASEDDRRQGVRNDNLLVWRPEDDNPHDSHRLGGRQAEAFEAIPIRLFHLLTWIGNSIDSPVVAWWAIRQNGLHPRLLKNIECQVGRADDLHKRARQVWSLILEYHLDPRNRQWDGDWYALKQRVAVEGWTPSVLRYFRRVTAPRVDIKPPYGVGRARPPQGPWDDTRLSHFGEFDIKMLEPHDEDLEIPDEALRQVCGILAEQFIVLAGLLADIELVYYEAPSCYPNREVQRPERSISVAEPLSWFVRLFDRMAALWPETAKGHAVAWPAEDRFFFRKLKLYAFNNVAAFEADYVAEQLLCLDLDAFWDQSLIRELLFLMVDRWREFSEKSRHRLAERILAGPDSLPYTSPEEFPALRDKFAARYARYLELKGCALNGDQTSRLGAMLGAISGWSDVWATSIVIERGSHVGWVGLDEKPDAVIGLPVNEVVPRAKEELKRDFDSLTEKRPFTGLVKANPRKALSALTIAGKVDDHPEAFWSAMINELPADVTPRLRRVFLNRLARLPQAAVVDLRYTLGRWLEQNLVTLLEFDEELAWKVYDHIVDGILAGGAESTESSLGDVRHGEERIQRSRRTFSHAINGPVGMCTMALFHAVPGDGQKPGSLVPGWIKSRVERLFSAPGEGSDHAVSVASSKLNWLMFVDPGWVRERFIPMLDLDHPASVPAWNGFVRSERVPWEPLSEAIKPFMLKIFAVGAGLAFDRDLTKVVAQWLGYMRVFHPDEPAGLSRSEMRSVLRGMSDDARSQFIFWLRRVGMANENGWVKYVIPFIEADWPRERRYRTSESVTAWIRMLNDTGDNFPAVYEVVKPFLVAVETNTRPFYRFIRAVGDEKQITVLFPEETLDLMHRLTPSALSRPSYELPEVLGLIAEIAPKLTSDPRYLRLVELVERS